MTMVPDAMTGMLRMLIADGGLLTDLRTATAGRARYQLLALLEVRLVEQVTVWCRRRHAAEQYRRDMAAAGVLASLVATAREAVQGAEVVITATSSTRPLIEAGCLAAARTVTAVGSDMPHKQELDPQVLVAAGKYEPDSTGAGRDVPLGDW
jgi:ornithine cyclodeaminase/alanine dehydrogenase-like protein (mu-crystallin family)